MAGDTKSDYTIFHFAQSNPKGRDQGNVPRLLRRVAKTIAEKGDITVQDIIFHTELDDEAEWWPSLTVYYSRDAEN
jgi:hypothetical protein